MRIKVPLLVVLIILIVSCRGRRRDDIPGQGPEHGKADVNISAQAMIEIIENVSSPIEMAALVKKLGVPFSSRYLSDPETIDSNSTSFKLAYSLGILGADLGYLNIYGKTGIFVNYLSSISRLADSLKIRQFFDFDRLKKLAESESSLDSLMFMSVYSFNEMDKYLRKTDRSNLSTLMVAGIWIEGMYLTTQVARIRPDKYLSEYIGEQKQTLNNLLVILSNYKNDTQFASLISDYEIIKSHLDDVKITYIIADPVAVEKDGTLTVIQQEQSVVDIPDETLKRVIESTEEIRNKHLAM
jgi:hypothetical protein